ncbi:LPXTG cell wall anchor domain-containing protein [Kitasatospora phosalacinea]|uniref:LPXTG cell wall anchor domain-containing protein n=1 Tax=Kitasatospora phosalacinea TaxID=2065 RepID=UPI0005269871|nr:LPXTG cell wall anchor domain-containing protein [Kitasatospora phosalacinea]
MVQRRPPLSRTPRALCAALLTAGLLVPLAAAPAVSATPPGAGAQRPTGPGPARPGDLVARSLAAGAPGPGPSTGDAPRSAPGPGEGGRLPDTGSAGALPLIGLAALGCVLAGLMALAARARRRH